MSDDIRKYYNKAFDKIEVPVNLLETIEQIALRQQESIKEGNTVNAKHHEYKERGFKSRKSVLTVVLAAVLILGAAGVYAAVSGLWSRGLTGTVRSNPEEQQALIDAGFAVPLSEENQGLAQTINGVTIKPNMVLTDGKVAYISFLIEGYDYEIGPDEKPLFVDEKESPLQYIRDAKDPEKEIIAASMGDNGFYSDVIYPVDGSVMYSDGTEARINPDGTPVGRYKDENGNMEYIIRVMSTGGKVFYDDPYGFNWETADSLYGTVFHIEFRDLGTTYSGSRKIISFLESELGELNISQMQQFMYKNVVEGTWTFDITMPDQSETSQYINTYELNAQLEDTDCFIKTVKVSPISVEIDFTVSKPKNKRGGDNAFELQGLRLKDGSVIKKKAMELPLVLYGNTEEERQELIALDHVTDPEQVEALLVNLYAYSDEIEIRLQE